jgi:hypothetical protein
VSNGASSPEDGTSNISRPGGGFLDFIDDNFGRALVFFTVARVRVVGVVAPEVVLDGSDFFFS